MGIVSTPIPMFPFNKWMMVSVFLEFFLGISKICLRSKWSFQIKVVCCSRDCVFSAIVRFWLRSWSVAASTSTSKYTWTGGEADDGEVEEDKKRWWRENYNGHHLHFQIHLDRWRGWWWRGGWGGGRIFLKYYIWQVEGMKIEEVEKEEEERKR